MRKVNVGIIGLGPVWEHRYLPALKKLRERIAVRTVYDPVTSRAGQVASQLGAEVVEGQLALLERSDVAAVLLLDSHWHQLTPLRFLHKKRKPVYIAGSLGEDAVFLQEMYQTALSDGLTFMPEFSRRYTPATGRLQELMATQIGRPRRITIDAVTPHPQAPLIVPGQGPGIDFLVGLLDWCRYIIRTAPYQVRSSRLNEGSEQASGGLDAGCCLKIEYARPRSGGSSPIVQLSIHNAQPHGSGVAATEEEPPNGAVRFEVECEKGRATSENPTEISWTTGGEWVKESLTADRSEVEVMLDLFCRRVVGGLLPVADLNDICRCMLLARAAEESLYNNKSVLLNGQPV